MTSSSSSFFSSLFFDHFIEGRSTDPLLTLSTLQRSSLPLFHDQQLTSSHAESRAWSMWQSRASVPLFHYMKQGEAAQLVVFPVSWWPLDTSIKVAPALTFSVRSQVSLDESSSRLLASLIDNGRMALHYRGRIVKRLAAEAALSRLFAETRRSTNEEEDDFDEVSGIGQEEMKTALENDAVIETVVGVSATSLHTKMMVRLNPPSHGWPASSWPCYLTLARTWLCSARARLEQSQTRVCLQARPTHLTGDRTFITMEMKRDNLANEDRWRGQLLFTQQVSGKAMSGPSTSLNYLLPALAPAPKRTIDHAIEHTRTLYNTLQERVADSWNWLQQASHRVFPDVFDISTEAHQRPSTFSNTAVSISKPASTFMFPRFSNISPLLAFPFPSFTTVGVSTPLNVLPYTQRRQQPYRLDETQWSHALRDTNISFGYQMYPSPSLGISFEHFRSVDMHSTICTLTTMNKGIKGYADVGLVKHSTAPGMQFHVGFGFSSGSY